MKLPIYQVDVFTNEQFKGNPAAVVLLNNEWLSEIRMQSIAMENNLAETAFVLRKNNSYHIRWFTPRAEVELCGHATMAASYVLFNELKINQATLTFSTQQVGNLWVKQKGDRFELNFPLDTLKEETILNNLWEGIGVKPEFIFKGNFDYLFVYSNEEQIRQIKPDLKKLMHFGSRGVIVTAPGDSVDFVSRFFAPAIGIDEDPVTGSAHTSLMPYWSKRLKKQEFIARQLSERTGTIFCSIIDNRALISGEACLYLRGEIEIE